MGKNAENKGIGRRARLIVAGRKDFIITLISLVSVTIIYKLSYKSSNYCN
jgi:hypothetical protein